MGENSSPLSEDFSSILFRQSGFKDSRVPGFWDSREGIIVFSLGPLTP
jgi:hypothetical protein